MLFPCFLTEEATLLVNAAARRCRNHFIVGFASGTSFQSEIACARQQSLELGEAPGVSAATSFYRSCLGGPGGLLMPVRTRIGVVRFRTDDGYESLQLASLQGWRTHVRIASDLTKIKN
jgi:hypothetical protein